MPTKFYSVALIGLEAVMVEVEADVSRATLPIFKMVGLPDASVRESQERVRAAIKNSGLPFPHARITINLAPAHIKKEGPVHDLAVALAIINATGNLLPVVHKKRIFLGELALDGTVRPFIGALPSVMTAIENGAEEIFFPLGNATEVALAIQNSSQEVAALPVKNITEVLLHLTGAQPITALSAEPTVADHQPIAYPIDLAFIRGQAQAKRALEIAAAGGHNVLLTGPPGSGKTMLARALPSILPPMTREEMLEVTKIRSVAGKLSAVTNLETERPFRSPHHTASNAALIGGGSWPSPGEVSLAHHGVLFLDELPEFPRHVLEALRQPLEDGFVTISRAQCTLRFPARFTLIAARNPCPCGYATDSTHTCTCRPTEVERYSRKISGPLLDRIDLHVDVPRVDPNDLLKRRDSESSEVIRRRVTSARERMIARLSDERVLTNAELNQKQIEKFCCLGADAEKIFYSAIDRLKMSARAIIRTLKVARTIADLAGVESIQPEHLAEALQFRLNG